MSISTRKQSAAFAAAGIPAMPQTRANIWRNVTAAVPAAVLSGMTARQIAGVIAAAHRSFCDGRAHNAAEVIDDAVWIGAGVDRLVPLAAIRAIKEHRSTLAAPYGTRHTTRYHMDYIERI